MAESLEDFLRGSKPAIQTQVSGSLGCQECDQTVNNGYLDEDTRILTYVCINGHTSQVRI